MEFLFRMKFWLKKLIVAIIGLLPSRKIRRWAKEYFFVPRFKLGGGTRTLCGGRIAVAFCFDKNLERHAMTTICSLLENSRGVAHYDIYCITDSGLTAKYEKLVATLDIESTIKFIAPTNDFDKPKYGWPVSVYYRLMLPKLLPGVARVVYADIDGVFMSDLAAAASFDMEGSPIAGCRDIGPGYINSGFLIMDLEKMRREKSYDDFVYLQKFDFKYPDQDIINIVFKNRIAYLPWEYNFRPVDAKDMIKTRLQSYKDWRRLKRHLVYVHFHWQPKPWNGLRVMGSLWKRFSIDAQAVLSKQAPYHSIGGLPKDDK
ncbi:MAG: glycosyltransferase family 8 protein [Rickettsiales bacterium]|jgi:lipopolysaccharide biosynthesis glycosyltransferase|nr:glycosyltransferase family 8 protein [Rickettsiales bacterium]